MELLIETKFDGSSDIWNVKINGEVDLFNSGEMKTKLLAILEKKPADIVIDCSNLDYIDSTALGALVAVLKNTKECGHNVCLKKIKPNIEKLFRITNLNKVFNIEGDQNDDK